MREKQFRGISEHFGTMEYGSDFKLNNVNVGGGEMEQWAFVNGNKIITKTFGEFTGISDCNNRKIFEGDIIKGGIRLMTIIFKQEACQFWLIWQDKDGINRYEPLTATYGDDTNYFSNDGFEVIGNIHENADLLN